MYRPYKYVRMDGHPILRGSCSCRGLHMIAVSHTAGAPRDIPYHYHRYRGGSTLDTTDCVVVRCQREECAVCVCVRHGSSDICEGVAVVW